jgi:hypothetical protein
MKKVIYSDDSDCNQYHGLALVIIDEEQKEIIENNLWQIIKNNNIKSEFKWSKLGKDRYFSCAKDMIELTFQNLDKISIEAVVWSDKDYREKIQGKLDSENVARYYYHLLKSPIKNLNSEEIIYYPDQQEEIDWLVLENYLNKKDDNQQKSFIDSKLLKTIKILPLDSKTEALIQLADILVGLIVTSWGDYKNKKANNLNLFESLNLNKTQKNKWEIIHLFNSFCKRHKLQVSLSSSQGLLSYNKKHNIHIWRYASQGEYDKAPQKLIQTNIK